MRRLRVGLALVLGALLAAACGGGEDAPPPVPGAEILIHGAGPARPVTAARSAALVAELDSLLEASAMPDSTFRDRIRIPTLSSKPTLESRGSCRE